MARGAKSTRSPVPSVPPENPSPIPAPSREALVGGFVWFAGLLVLLSLIRASYPYVNGDDIYYHLRVAATLREQGVWNLDRLPWTRMSVFNQYWGDKEWLFHALMVPFADGDLLFRSKIMLSFLNAVEGGLIAFLGIRWVGRTGWFLPALVAVASANFLVRMEQLRPHHLSIILLLIAMHLTAIRRHRWLGLVAVLYALSYTAWQSLLILVLGVFAVLAVIRREIRPGLVLWTIAGLALGLLMHPGFPDNLRIWMIQNVEFFKYKDQLPVALEFRSLPLPAFLVSNAPGLLLILLAAVCAAPWRWTLRWRQIPPHELVFFVFGSAFLLLYLQMLRFAEYAIPFVAIALLVPYCRIVARTVPAVMPAPVRQAVAGLIVAGGMYYWIPQEREIMRYNAGLGFSSAEDREHFSRVLPAGAKVAASWDNTPYYIYAAPQAAYLNVLDPIFMEAAHPGLNQFMESVFLGMAPDVPHALRRVLDSDYIAYNADVFSQLMERLSRDPRAIPLYTTPPHRIYAFDTSSTHDFVTDWRLGATAAPDVASYLAERPLSNPIQLPPYDPAGLKAFVEWPGPSPGPCWWASRKWTPEPGVTSMEILFGAAGPLDIHANGTVIKKLSEGQKGLVDAGRMVLNVTPGKEYEWQIRSCTDRQYGNGFFWRQRPAP